MKRKPLEVYILLLLCGLLLSSASAAPPPKATPVHEADAVCAQCHRAIFQSYLATPMANASGAATDRLIPGGFLQASSSIDYRVFADGDAAWLSYRKRGDPEIEGRERLEYFLGSGHLGLTYLYSRNGYLLESPIAYYPDLKTYDMKPGFENARHLPAALPVDSTCLRCHMSGAQAADPGTDNHYPGLPFLHAGITCESCHGDTRRHIATAGAAVVVNPIKLEPEKRDSTCVVCHLEGATNVQRRGRSAIDYQPGQDIADYIAYFAYERENTTERGVSEIEQFTSSTCKQASGAGMSCMNCHDPHRSPAPAERAAYYRGKCLACHAAPKYASGHFPGNPDCAGCHMPKTGSENIPHVAWTDHRIRRRPGEAVLADLRPEGPRALVPILPGPANSRDLALAYYDLAVKGNSAEKPRAIALLHAAAKSSPEDPAVLQALGVLAQWDGDGARSQELYRAVLKQDPSSLTASTNLGTLLAKAGELEAAAALWRPTFERDQDVLALGENLATVACLLGEKDLAVKTLKAVLLYSPDTPETRGKLRAIESGQQQCSPNTPHPTLLDP